MAKQKTRKRTLSTDVKAHLEAFETGVRYLFKPRATLMYPEVFQEFAPNYRGMLKFHDDRCISCSMCARICPSGAIKMYKGAKKWPGITYQRCIFCGFCVDICPVNALEMTSVHDKASCGLEGYDLKPEELREGPPIEKAPKKVKVVFDEKRGLKYE